MPASKIRANYNDLKRISQIFSRQGSAMAAMNRKIKSAQQALQSGDWIGQGAKVFFREMDGDVNPSLKRLEKAMVQAGRVTNQIAAEMKKAEDEAKGFFHL